LFVEVVEVAITASPFVTNRPPREYWGNGFGIDQYIKELPSP
jgi:hypothetical protein